MEQNNFDKARDVLRDIDGIGFPCTLSAYEGGTCGDSYVDDSQELYLTGDNIRFLLKEQMNNDTLFEGMSTGRIDLDTVLEEMAIESSFPDGDYEENDYWSCSGSSLSLEIYLEEMALFIDMILAGKTEDRMIEIIQREYFGQRCYEDEYGLEDFLVDVD